MINSSTNFPNIPQHVLNGVNLSAVESNLKPARLDFQEFAKVLQVPLINRSGIENVGILAAIPAPDFLAVPNF